MTFEVVKRTARDRLGEGPVWIASRGELAWVDIDGCAVHRLHLTSSKVVSLTLPEKIGWVLPRQNARECVAGMKSGFALLDLDTGAFERFGYPEADRPGNRLNDAKTDRWGRIWAGSKDDVGDSQSGALYRLDTDLAWHRVDDNYGVTNGPTFSLDGQILYHTDSAARTVYAFDVDETGALVDKRIWLQFESDWGYPDGMTTDAEGCLWIAHWGGARISRFSPKAEKIASIALPTTNITSCAFAGEKLDRLFVTSSTIDCEDEKLAGALFEVEPGVRGLAPTPFAG